MSDEDSWWTQNCLKRKDSKASTTCYWVGLARTTEELDVLVAEHNSEKHPESDGWVDPPLGGRWPVNDSYAWSYPDDM